MSVFRLYLDLGLDHILDFKGYDHILFLVTLCSVYTLAEWKRVLILITAFTVGHSTTLVLATFHILKVSAGTIEFLIPLTIFITALFNALHRQQKVSRMLHFSKYSAALFFGLIHGLGFSSYLKGLLGNEANIVNPLFAFNVGIELGQIIVVLVVLGMSYIAVGAIRVKAREWNLVLSGMGLGISLMLMLERFPW